MHKVGLQLTDYEFRKMPIRRFYEYLTHCYRQNEEEKEEARKNSNTK